ncbi:MAG: TonB-dependent receptor [Saprospiraceae bacterium]|nr:TonB-dependent receptor [Saprospiraceae bacterium]
MRNFILLLFSIFSFSVSAQLSINGVLQDENAEPIPFSNIVLHSSEDEAMVKVETSDLDGNFSFKNINEGSYYVVATFVGYNDFRSELINLSGNPINMGILKMVTSSVQLETAVVKARRSLVEVKPDRTVFNVEGTINSVGDNALGLLRKAPGVLVDNNNNISVLSRAGVLVYVDGKRLPLAGDELTAYLTNLPAEQIDRMEIITNPGAKYEAEGNAGIIDIRMKRDKSHGMNGSLSGTITQGKKMRGNLSSVGNYRNKLLNSFGTLGFNDGRRFNEMYFVNNQNGLRTDESNYSENRDQGFNYRWGTDFFLGKNHTVGFLLTGGQSENTGESDNIIAISRLSSVNTIDSVLVATNSSLQDRDRSTYNFNYAFDNKAWTVNFDLDYGKYRNDSEYIQPNRYFNSERTELLTEVLTEYDTPVDIDIYTAKVDFETDIGGGRLGFGSKFSKVDTDNTFLFYNLIDGNRVQDDRRSNQFNYDENVYAGYVNYQRKLNEKLNFSAGLRVEATDAVGDLKAFLPELQEDPVDLEYTDFFPSAGLTYNLAYNKTLSFNYGRRINRPDYNVLNPFTVQLSELSFQKGNERLNPEIVNNFELGYTLNFRYNFKLSYSKTTDQITRLIAPDDEDPRAGFITWANLAEQTVYGFNISAPFGVSENWNMFVNFNSGYLDNQADYGDGAVVDVQAFTYSIFQQSTFTLPKGFTAEISGYYSGPGVWGGVFEYDSNYSLNFGLQKKFFNDQMNVKVSANDVTYQTGWSGFSNFDGLIGTGRGNWDSRNVNLSISYNFGNSNVKSRRRSTGIESESKRVN